MNLARWWSALHPPGFVLLGGAALCAAVLLWTAALRHVATRSRQPAQQALAPTSAGSLLAPGDILITDGGPGCAEPRLVQSHQGDQRTLLTGSPLAQPRQIRVQTTNSDVRVLIADAGAGLIAFDPTTGRATPLAPAQVLAAQAVALTPNGSILTLAGAPTATKLVLLTSPAAPPQPVSLSVPLTQPSALLFSGQALLIADASTGVYARLPGPSERVVTGAPPATDLAGAADGRVLLATSRGLWQIDSTLSARQLLPLPVTAVATGGVRIYLLDGPAKVLHILDSSLNNVRDQTLADLCAPSGIAIYQGPPVFIPAPIGPAFSYCYPRQCTDEVLRELQSTSRRRPSP